MFDTMRNIKMVSIYIIVFVLITGIVFSAVKPKMHKPFQLNIVEYMLKFNTNDNTPDIKQDNVIRGN